MKTIALVTLYRGVATTAEELEDQKEAIVHALDDYAVVFQYSTAQQSVPGLYGGRQTVESGCSGVLDIRFMHPDDWTKARPSLTAQDIADALRR